MRVDECSSPVKKHLSPKSTAPGKQVRELVLALLQITLKKDVTAEDLHPSTAQHGTCKLA